MTKAAKTICKILMPVFAVMSAGTLIIGFAQPIEAVEQKAIYLVATLILMGLSYLSWHWTSEPKSQL
ncbi:hypothetical protein [Marinobacter salicampi]|uniref:hypothetical protein n=1 Tax=Marinobacter salicampi TaxID=435907 RepID=UPI00140759AE|nr:hypothetical protein [Marinobacter salicampi]